MNLNKLCVYHVTSKHKLEIFEDLTENDEYCLRCLGNFHCDDYISVDEYLSRRELQPDLIGRR